MIVRRNRTKHLTDLETRCAEEARRLREQADLLSPGKAPRRSLRKACQAETASQMSEWLKSPGLQAPK